MKIVLTGITGNIGNEVARLLLREGHTVIPIVRPKPDTDIPQRLTALHSDFSQIKEYISVDLEKEVPNYSLEGIDCIIHCAGVVHFKKAGNCNEEMMKNLLTFAKDSSIPLYYVSTAYLYKPSEEPLFNQYEMDKQKAEDCLVSSSLPYSILRPSIVTGNSGNGELIHFSGYYLVVPYFVEALKNSDKVRFPGIQNQVNIIPVDWVARSVVDTAIGQNRGMFYITNPHAPTLTVLLRETLRFFNLDDRLEFIDMSFEDYKNLDLSDEERKLFNACMPFIPYLTTSYDFPPSLCTSALPAGYIEKILTYFSKSKDEKSEG